MENHSNNTALYQKMQAEFEYFKDFIKRGFPMQELKEGEKL